MSGAAFGRIFSFIFNLLLSRVLGPSGLGAFNLAITTVQTFEVASQAGLDYGLSCETIGTEPQSKAHLIQTSLNALNILKWVLGILSLPLSAWLLLNSQIFSTSGENTSAWLLIAIFSACIFEGSASLRWQIILLWGKTRLYSLRQGFLIPLKLFLSSLGALVGGTTGAILGFASVSLLQNSWLANQLKFLRVGEKKGKSLEAINLKSSISLIRLGFPLYLTNSITAIVFLPLLANVAVDAGLSDIGYLRSGQLIVQAFTLIPGSILPILFIKLRQTEEAEVLKQTEPSLRVVWGGGLLILLLYLTIDQPLVNLLFGAEFQASVQPTRILMLCAVLDAVNQILHTPLLAKRKLVLFSITQNSAAIAAAIVGSTLIPAYGLKGFLIAKILFSWIPVIVYGINSWGKFQSKHLLSTLGASTIAMTYLCWSANSNYYISFLIASAIGFAAALEVYALKKQFFKSMS